ncbi:hypothetical protein BABINDRAFT_163778 [Babjeviella inositovora NRRL Y-12698]|uniref:Uncharacterized protein n=1 Tax=Babjeviella inositovora NRRL Y-12698 TaxID=984486 RepID=A0A1E3QH72_9ASCO|nr:uncharacterized protein BABINDRAFT_163778 [Babjeviella inositovora NRRL Y-12698]ODQ77045.1 hypothetical protein BABINDRAFT_163778 [Babjeviella inositovora NRRL Y-12698]
MEFSYSDPLSVSETTVKAEEPFSTIPPSPFAYTPTFHFPPTYNHEQIATIKDEYLRIHQSMLRKECLPQSRLTVKQKRTIEKQETVHFFNTLRPIFKVPKHKKKPVVRPSDAIFSSILMGHGSADYKTNFFAKYAGTNYIEAQAEAIKTREEASVLEDYDSDRLQDMLMSQDAIDDLDLKQVDEDVIISYLSTHADDLDFAELNGFVRKDIAAEIRKFLLDEVVEVRDESGVEPGVISNVPLYYKI